MAGYDGRSGSSQVIMPGNSMQTSTWGYDEKRKQQKKMGEMLLKAAKTYAGGSGSESTELDMDALQAEDPDFADFEPDIDDGAFQETSISSSGIEDTDALFGEPEIEEAEAFPGEEGVEDRAYHIGTEDPRMEASDEASAEYLKAMQTGERLGQQQPSEYEMAQLQAQFNPAQQQTGSPYFGTGQAPQMPSQEEILRRRYQQAQQQGLQGAMRGGFRA
jgi:hypothetical protein